MRVAVVVQRFGDEIVGGAEAHARQLASKFASELNWDVTILTTRALDYRTWANELPSGKSIESNLETIRFSCSGRSLFFDGFNRLFSRLLKHTARLPVFSTLNQILEPIWYHLQGTGSVEFAEYLRTHKSDYDHFFFFTYLYSFTVDNLPLVAEKASLIPTAHDEAPFYFRTTRRLLQISANLFVNTEVEADLIKHVHPKTTTTMITAGLGFDNQKLLELPHPVNSNVALYMGRVGRAKNCQRMIESFLGYCKDYHDDSSLLKIAGYQEGDIEIPDHPQIRFLGVVTEQRKLELITEAEVIINPSSLESLSMIVLEAMAAKRFILANHECSIFRFYADQTSSVYTYRSPDEFGSKLNHLFSDRTDLHPRLDESRAWVQKNFSWDSILAKYASLASNKPS